MITLDLSDFFKEWQLTIDQAESFVDTLLSEIGARFSEEWHNLAGKELKQTRQEYQRGIYVQRPSFDSVIIGLDGWLPNAVEQGIMPFDMKEGFMNSSKRHLKKGGGWYLTVPFRLGTPGIVGDSGIFSSVMPQEVYEVAKKELKTRRSLPAASLPPQFQVKGVRSEILNEKGEQVFPAYQHKNPIYEGMTKSNKEGHSHYMTFRRVSDNSDPNSWIHSGIVAHDLLQKAFSSFNVEDIVSRVKEDFIKTLDKV